MDFKLDVQNELNKSEYLYYHYFGAAEAGHLNPLSIPLRLRISTSLLAF